MKKKMVGFVMLAAAVLGMYLLKFRSDTAVIQDDVKNTQSSSKHVSEFPL